MNTYTVVVKPDIRLVAGELVELSEEAIAAELTGAVVHGLAQTNWGLYVADLQLRRPTHEQALDDISSALERLGCSFVEAAVREWVTEALEEGRHRRSGLIRSWGRDLRKPARRTCLLDPWGHHRGADWLGGTQAQG